MKRILVAFDDSPGAEAAMRDIVRAGFPEKCQAKVLTIADVWLPPDPADPGFPDEAPPSRVAERRRAVEALAAAREISVRGANQLRSLFSTWEVQNAAHADSPAWGILAEARRWPSDVVVIGSHGRSPLQKLFLGSVSYKVAAEASCSVRIFKAHHRTAVEGSRILIALDGSNDSEAAFQEALLRRWPENTMFQLVTVLDHKIRSGPIGDAGAFPGAPNDTVEKTFTAMLEAKADEFRKRKFEVGIQLLDGEPKSALLHHASGWEADCIFLGARGQQHGERLYLGTFASAIVTRAHCTVEIVRPPFAPRLE